MKKSISVFCGDKYLRQKIYHILSDRNQVILQDIFATPTKEALSAELIIWNLKDKPLPRELSFNAITLGDGGELTLPFSEEMLLSAIEKRGSEGGEIPLILGEKCAHLYGRTVRLTDAEFSLLSVLYEARGEFVSREELIGRVWGSSTTEGILNVYIHYLREKLEFRGEKIIISSRRLGYKIDKKYLTNGGEDLCSE